MERERHHVRQAAANARRHGGRRVHVVGDTIVDSYTHCAMIGGQTKTPTMSVLFERKVDYVGGAGDRRQAPRGGRRRGDVLDRARRRQLPGLRPRRPQERRRRSACRDRPDAADDQQECDRRRRLPAAQGRHARQPLDLRPDPRCRSPSAVKTSADRRGRVLRFPPRHLQPPHHPRAGAGAARGRASGSPTARWPAAGATSPTSRASI